MNHLSNLSSSRSLKLLGTGLLTSMLVACNSSDSSSSVGYVKFYHASSTAPEIIFTVDENLETSDDDEIEISYNAIGYGESLSYAEYTSGDYFYELAWQDDDSSERADLAIISQGDLSIADNMMQFVVIDGDVTAPQVNVYQYEMIEDDDDDLYSLFNLRVINTQADTLDVYYSKADETFNEAQLFDSVDYQMLASNQKLEQGSYVFYLTNAATQEVVYQSEEVTFSYSTQYVLAIRANPNNPQSPYLIDRIANTSYQTLPDVNAQAQVSLYNAIPTWPSYLPDYQGSLDVYLDIESGEPLITNLSIGELSEVKSLDNGDFSLAVNASGTDISLLKNHLLSLPENSLKTVFLYADEAYVDEDGDGDIDEDGDGQVDEVELNVHTLVVDQSTLTGTYSHDIHFVNLVDDDTYSSVQVYFVRANETISNAQNRLSAGFATTSAINLNNNTYDVFLVAQDNSSDVILANFILTLDETSQNQFLIIEQDDISATGFTASMVNQQHSTNADE